MSRGGLRPVRRRSRMTASVIASMSFMSTAPRPQMLPSSAISPEKGCTAQSAASAGTTSRWPWISSARAAAVLAFDAGDDRRALGLRLEDGRLDADLGELGGDVFGRVALVAVSPAAVDRLEAQQVAAQLDDFVLGARHPSIVTADRRKCVQLWITGAITLPGCGSAVTRRWSRFAGETPSGLPRGAASELGITSRAPSLHTCSGAHAGRDGSGRAARMTDDLLAAAAGAGARRAVSRRLVDVGRAGRGRVATCSRAAAGGRSSSARPRPSNTYRRKPRDRPHELAETLLDALLPGHALADDGRPAASAAEVPTWPVRPIPGRGGAGAACRARSHGVAVVRRPARHAADGDPRAAAALPVLVAAVVAPSGSAHRGAEGPAEADPAPGAARRAVGRAGEPDRPWVRARAVGAVGG